MEKVSNYWNYTMLLRLLTVAMFAASSVVWYGLELEMTDNHTIAAGMTAIMVVAPAALVSFLIPRTAAGQLLLEQSWGNIGYVAIMACTVWLLWYEYHLQEAWWLTQPTVRDSGYAWSQAITMVIGFIVIPGLAWSSVNSDQLMEQLRQKRAVDAYRAAHNLEKIKIAKEAARMRILAGRGWARLNLSEREEYLQLGISAVNGMVTAYNELAEALNSDVEHLTEYSIPGDSLEGTQHFLRAAQLQIRDLSTDHLLPSLLENPPVAQTGKTKPIKSWRSKK